MRVIKTGAKGGRTKNSNTECWNLGQVIRLRDDGGQLHINMLLRVNTEHAHQGAP